MPLLHPADIQIRDPFVLPVVSERRYYLYGTTDKNCWDDKVTGTGFECYHSPDLRVWEGPFPVFRPEPGFWGHHHFWAPEVHAWRGRYFMFASFKAHTLVRGTQILAADHPLGPFRPHSPGAVTPPDCECLDGTLHVAPDGRPWMIFSRDWTQVTVGCYSAIPLKEDLSASDGPAFDLFPVNAAPWVRTPPWQAGRDKEGQPPCFVADGAWPFPMRDGKLGLVFSSWCETGYATGLARSDSGDLHGPWRLDSTPFFSADGGHAMIFPGFDGRRYLTLHQPNSPAPEHPCFFFFDETAGRIRLTDTSL